MSLALEHEEVIRWKVPRLLDWQRQVVNWEPPEGCRYATIGVLTAAWGTGKTFTAAARFARTVMRYGTPGSAAICTAPIAKTLDTTMPQAIERFLPGDFIRSRMKPHNTVEWILQNGCRVVFWSMKGYIDSIDNVICTWADEAHDRLFLDPLRWDRLIGRARGNAQYRELIVSGIAINDETFKGRFDRPEDPTVHIVLPGLEDSWAGQHDPGFVERSVADKPKDLVEVLKKGGWVPPPLQAFPHLVLDASASDTNVWTDDVMDWMSGELPVTLTLDNGEQYGALVCAEIPIPAGDGKTDKAMLCLQSWCFDRMETGEVISEIQETTDYRITRVIVDTDAPREVRHRVRDYLPGVPIDDLKKGGREWRLDTKLEKFQWAICSGDGVRRFFMAERMLKEGKRQLAHLLRTAEIKPDGKLSKPNDEHVRDCAIYAACVMLRRPKPKRDYRDQ